MTPLEQWQIKEIELGIQEADNGELVSHEMVVNNWKNHEQQRNTDLSKPRRQH